MPFKRSSHSTYDCWYHLVWTPKRRKHLLVGQVASRLEEIFRQIGVDYDIEFGALHIDEDHVHLYCSFPPRLSISKVVTILKSLSARALFAEFPVLSIRLPERRLWQGGYCVRTVGDGIDGTIVRRYIERHKEQEDVLDL